MRKYMSKINPITLQKSDIVPFNSWECITLQIKGRADVYLVIKNEKIMDMFLKMLVYKLRTMDGTRDSAKKFIELIMQEKKKQFNVKIMDKNRMKIIEKEASHLAMQETMTRYRVLKVK